MGILRKLAFVCVFLLLIPALSRAECVYTAGSISCALTVGTDDGNGSESQNFFVPYSSSTNPYSFRQKINIPKNATVSTALVNFGASTVIGSTPFTSTACTNCVDAELYDSDNYPVITSSSGTGAVVAGLKVTFSVGAYTTGDRYNTANLASLFNSWIGRAGYGLNQYIGLRFQGAGTKTTHPIYQGYSGRASTDWTALTLTFTGGDPTLDVYMADPHVRTKQYLYIQLYNTTATQKLVVTLDGSPVSGSPFTNIPGQTVSGEQKVLVDYTVLTASAHTLRAVVTDAADVEIASTVWTRTWTTLHNGAPYMGIDENNNFIKGGQKLFLITDFLQDASKWSNYPASGDIWSTWFNTSWLLGSVSNLATIQAYVTSATTGAPPYAIAPTHGGIWGWGGFSYTIPSYSAIDYSFSETFEGAGTVLGACGTVGFCWSSSGTVDFDYTAAPLVGSQSLQVTGDSYAQLLLGGLSRNCTGSKAPYSCCTGASAGCPDTYGHVGITFHVKPTTRSGSSDIVVFVDDTNEIIGKLKVNASNKLEFHHCAGGTCTGTMLGTGTYNFATNTEHYVWVDFESDLLGSAYKFGSVKVYASATSTKTLYINLDQTGAGQGLVKYIRLASSADNVMVFDNVEDGFEDMKKNITGLKDIATYPKMIGWVWDDEIDKGGNSDWNSKHYLWKEFAHTQDTNRPVFGGLYGANYDPMQSAANLLRGSSYMLYLTNAEQYGGVRTLFADAAAIDLYFFEYSLHSDPLTSGGDHLGWYPDFVNYVNGLDYAINGMYNLIPFAVCPEVDDLSESLCYNNTTYYNFACSSYTQTMNVPVGSVSGTFTASTKAAPKYVRFAGDNTKVAELLDVRLNEGTAADNYKFKVLYPYPHPNYNSHIVIHELNTTFDSDTLANGDAIVDCTAINGDYGSVTCTATGTSTAQVITGTAGKVPRLGEGDSKYRPPATARAWTPMPTPQGLKNMMWLSVIHGAKYVVIFPYWTMKYLWMHDTLKTFRDTIEALSNVILVSVASTKFTIPSANTAGWTTVTDGAGTARVDYTVRTYGGVDYVFAARVKKHSGDTSGDATVSIPVIGLANSTTCAVYGESRSVVSGSGTIADSFNDHDVHIYALGEASESYSLTITKVGDGSGTVTSSPAGIDCGATCNYSFASGSSVVLTASVTGNNALGAWSGGGCTGNGATCTVSMTEALAVSKSFADTTPRNFNVTRSYAGTGTGTTNPAAGVSAYAGNATATTTQTPGDNSTFTAWSGSCGCTGSGACAPTITADCTIIATWADNPKYTLTIQYPPNGERVVSEANGIYCGGNSISCQGVFYSGTVILTGACAPYFYNLVWTGDGTGTTTRTFTMNANQNISVSCTNGRAANLGTGGAVTIGGSGTITLGE